jgi:hypothetical protein
VTSARPSDVNGASGGATPASPERSDRRRRDSAASAICCPGWRTSSPATALALGLQTNVPDHIHAIDTNPSACGNSENRPRYEVMGDFRTEIAEKGAPRGVMKGTTAIARARFGSGRVICFSPHPELTEGLGWMLRDAVRWVGPCRETAPGPERQTTPAPTIR